MRAHAPIFSGIFWLDWQSTLNFFDVAYVSWAPSLFPFTWTLHAEWNANQGPTKGQNMQQPLLRMYFFSSSDHYTISHNPQYKIEVEDASDVGGSIWFLLSRHILDKVSLNNWLCFVCSIDQLGLQDDFEHNKEFITLIVYEGGKKVHLPSERSPRPSSDRLVQAARARFAVNPKPIVDGARINSPHYLCKLTVPAGEKRRYTLVVAQYEKTATIYFTLKVYSTLQFTCNEIVSKFKSTQTVRKCSSDHKRLVCGF